MPDPTIEERLDWLQLARARGVGPQRIVQLLERFATPARVLREAQTRLPIEPLPRDAARRELDAIAGIGGQLITLADEAYPASLRAIADPPSVLTVLGRLELLCGWCVAIVGARNASGNGRRFAQSLAEGCAHAGLTVVSGLARGIDAAAHEGALNGPGSTIAVVGCGADIVYPPENAELTRRVVETAALVSEHPWGAPPLARHFPRRNRIISGLSCGVVVVEAAERSGSLMTARLALDQGREVLAVPGSPLDQRHKGTNRLLRDGAALVECVQDIVDALPRPSAPRRPAPERRISQPPATPQERPIPAQPAPPAAIKRAIPTAARPLPERLHELLGPHPLSVDELIRQCHASTAEVQQVLLDLELDGRLIRLPGNRVALELG